MKQGVDLELRQKSTLLYFKHCKEPNWLFSTPQPWSIFSAICYDERQAPIVRGMRLVIFSRSYHWKIVNLLFHVFRQEITVSVVGQFRMRGEKSIIFKRRILELISVPLKRRHITVLKTYMSFLFSPFCTPQWVIIINKETLDPQVKVKETFVKISKSIQSSP